MRVLISVSTRKYFGKCVYLVTASAVGTTLLHSPGWNEGKARNGTLGTHRQKRIELRRSGTYPLKQMPQRINTLRRKTTNRNDTNQMRAVSAAPLGLNKCVSMLNPGLAPWAMQEYRPYRALLRPRQLLAYSDALVLAVLSNQMFAYFDALLLARP